MPGVTKPKPKGADARTAAGPFWGPGRFLLVVALLVTVSASLFVLRAQMQGLGRFAQAAAVLRIVQDEYVQETNADELSRAAISGMLNQLGDPNSVYIPPAVAEQFNRVVMGSDYVGIGVQVQRRDGYVTITSPMAGTPAARAGVQPGDRILAVDGVDTRELDTEEVTGLIAGPRGQSVLLTLEREGEEITLDIVRGEIRAESVRGLRRINTEGAWSHALDREHGIGYIRVSQFVGGTAAATLASMERARSQLGELNGLVLDLRHNPGGAIGEAVGVVDLFLDGGPVVRTENRAGESMTLEASAGVAFGGPIVVLIDEVSASGSEIVAGALVERKNNARALGTRTFGKASVQTVYGLPDGGTLKLTEAHYLLPSGRNLQRTPGATEWGVDPSPGMHVRLGDGGWDELGQLFARLEAVGGDGINGGIPSEAWNSASTLLAAMGDAQLTAAHRALVGVLTTGQWSRVGGDAVTGERALRIEQIQRTIERMEFERQRLERDLEQLREAS